MPHITVEYSANLAGAIGTADLMERLRRAALETGVFPLAGIRVRCIRYEEYCIADGSRENAFVHVLVRIGHGRDLETRKRAGEALFRTVCDYLAPVYESRPMGISLELQEAHPELNFKKNNMHERLPASGAARTAG